jgi:non-reducing end alpha-L-arabinofuranosidase
MAFPYVVAMVKGGTNGFALKGGDATKGKLTTLYDGPRPNGYQPMKKVRARTGGGVARVRSRVGSGVCAGTAAGLPPPRPSCFPRPWTSQQGSIILGVGGDNSDWALGSFFEGVVTAGYSTDAADAAVAADIAAAGYGM